MCEPFHSSIQFPDPDDFDHDGDGLTAQTVRGAFIGKLGKFFKKIGRWFHISKMAAGHSETLNSSKCVDMQIHNFIQPTHIKWEANWAERTTALDYADHNLRRHLDEARNAAMEYSKAVCYGNLTALRRFLTESLLNAAGFKLDGYMYLFQQQLLNTAGRTEFHTRYDRCFGKQHFKNIPRQAFVKFVLGFTRHRQFLCDAWADDTGLWLPRKETGPCDRIYQPAQSTIVVP